MKKIEVTVVLEHFERLIKALGMIEVDDVNVSEVQNMWGENMLPLIGDWCVPAIDYRKKIEIVVDDNQVDQIIHLIQQSMPEIKRSNFLPRPKYGNDIFISPVEQVIHIRTGEHDYSVVQVIHSNVQP